MTTAPLQDTAGVTGAFTAPVPLARDMLAAHLGRLFRAAAEANAHRRTATSSAGAWEGERQRLIGAYQQSLGPFPARTPLAPRLTGTLQRTGYRIEKLIYETQPGLLVTALAYVPHGRPPFPAVLVPCGHAENGKAAETYQRACAGLASKGYFVLTYDPIGQGERKLYWDPAAGASTLGGCTTQHSYAGNQCFLLGINLAQLMVWDSLRGLDYLAGRPEVDASRLAIAGNSGGGTNVAFTAPLDDRIKVAVPCCYITTLEWRRQAWSTGDAEQNLAGQLTAGLDLDAFLRLFAPRPILVGSAALDFFPLAGAVESVAAARDLYAALGAPDGIAHAVAAAPHGWSVDLRRATYGWLNRWLGVDAGDDEPDTPVESDADLQCTPDGQVALLGSLAIHDLHRRRLAGATPPRTRPLPESIRHLTAFESTADRPVAQPATTTLFRFEGVRQVERITVWPEPDVALPGAVWTWRAARRPLRPLLWIDREGVDVLAERPVFRTLLDRLLPAGWAFMAVDVRGRGETAPRSNSRTHPAMTAESFLTYESFVVGRPLFGMRLRDAQAALDALLAREDVQTGVQPAGAVVAGWGAGGLVALHLAALDRRVATTITVETPDSYRALVDHEHYRFPTSAIIPGVVRGPDSPDGYEVEDLATLITQRDGDLPARRLCRLRNVDHLGQSRTDESDEAMASALLALLADG